MGIYTVELVSDGKAIRRADVQAGTFADAAKVWGPVKDGLGKEPEDQDFIRVTHFASGRTNWFRPS